MSVLIKIKEKGDFLISPALVGFILDPVARRPVSRVSEQTRYKSLCAATLRQLVRHENFSMPIICVFVFAYAKSRFSHKATVIVGSRKLKFLSAYAIPQLICAFFISFLMMRLISSSSIRCTITNQICISFFPENAKSFADERRYSQRDTRLKDLTISKAL